MKRAFASAAALAALALSLAGCSTNDSTDASTESASASAVPSTITTQPATTGEPVLSNPGIGIFSSTVMESCDIAPGSVVAKGTVTPPADVAGTIQISVSWVDPATSSVMVSGTAMLEDWKAGEPSAWSITEELPATDKNVSCVMGSTVLPK